MTELFSCLSNTYKGTQSVTSSGSFDFSALWFSAYGFYLHSCKMAPLPPGILSLFQSGRRRKDQKLSSCEALSFYPERNLFPEASSYFLLTRILPHVHHSLQAILRGWVLLLGMLSFQIKLWFLLVRKKRMDNGEALKVYHTGYKYSRTWRPGGGTRRVNGKPDPSLVSLHREAQRAGGA